MASKKGKSNFTKKAVSGLTGVYPQQVMPMVSMQVSKPKKRTVGVFGEQTIFSQGGEKRELKLVNGDTTYVNPEYPHGDILQYKRKVLKHLPTRQEQMKNYITEGNELKEVTYGDS